jgi:hypothetical protein
VVSQIDSIADLVLVTSNEIYCDFDFSSTKAAPLFDWSDSDYDHHSCCDFDFYCDSDSYYVYDAKVPSPTS